MPTTSMPLSTKRSYEIAFVVIALGIVTAAANYVYGQTSPATSTFSVPPTGTNPGGYTTPGYTTPGYTTPGYTTPGYQTPGYVPTQASVGKTSPCPASVSWSACSSSGWALCTKKALKDTPKSVVIKATGPALYWYGANGKRFVFPNEATYRTWYPTRSACPVVRQVSDADLAAIPISTNVTYRPGTKLIKITTDPKTFAVSKGGVLRWLTTETITQQLFGSNWKMQVNDMPDAFFINYKMGPAVTTSTAYSPLAEQNSAKTIDQDKGLVK